MKSLGDSLGDMGFLISSRIVGTEFCEGCQQTITLREDRIKEKVYINRVNCKCEDNKLAKEAWQADQRLKKKRLFEFFIQNSLVNNELLTASFMDYVNMKEKQYIDQSKMEESMFDAYVYYLKYIQSFKPNKNENILLVGAPGVGKSHLIMAGINYLLNSGAYSVLFIDVPQLITHIKSTFHNRNVSEKQMIQGLLDIDLLVLDDIGSEQQTEWSTTKLFEIVNGRQGKCTIYTTNLTGHELATRYHERNISRMLKNTKIFKVTGRDLRVPGEAYKEFYSL